MPLYHTLLFFVFLHSYYLLCSSRPSFISSLPLSLYLRLLYLDYKLPLDRYPFPHGPPPPLHTHTHTLSLIQTLTHLRISVILCITLTGRVSIPQHRIVFISVAATTSLLFSFVFMQSEGKRMDIAHAFFLSIFLSITCSLPCSLSARLYRLYRGAVGYSCLLLTVNPHAHTYT